MTCPSAVSRAHTITTSAMVPFPIQRFRPSSTQVSPSSRALVDRAIESDPCSGSVSANAATVAPRTTPGIHRSTVAGFPDCRIG